MANIQKRTTQDGKVSYRAQVRLKGHPAQTATFQRLTDAKRWAQDTESAIRQGRYFGRSQDRTRTVADLLNAYRERVLAQMPDSAQRKRGPQLDWWEGQLGVYALTDVSGRLLGEARDRLQALTTPSGQPRSPATVVRYMAALSHVFSTAVEWEWIPENPLKKVKKPQEPRGRVRFLSEGERERLLETCRESPNPFLYPVVCLALYSGMRQGEIMGLTWGDVDFDRRRVILHETKNGERRAVPLAVPALKALADLKATAGEATESCLCFPGKVHETEGMNLRAPWVMALKKAGVQDFRFHDLRHSAASYLAMSGASLAEIAEVLGHKTLAMVKRYAHLSEGHTASVVERMASKFS